MSIRSLLAVLLICLSVPAAGDYVVVSEAYEVALADLRLPGTVNGTVTFKECEECDYRTIRVTSGTRYEANAQLLTLQDFQKELEDVPDPSEITATVLHHLESDTIQAIRVWL